MSTNYYMHTTDKDFVKKYFNGEYSLTDEPYLCYEIHIGKRSGGWKSLYATHKEAYTSVKEMVKFLEQHFCIEKKCTLEDEYDRTLTLDELKEELINFDDFSCKDNKKFTIGKHGELVEDENGSIEQPIDHLEFALQQKSADNPPEFYWKDVDGNDFMYGEFL